MGDKASANLASGFMQVLIVVGLPIPLLEPSLRAGGGGGGGGAAYLDLTHNLGFEFVLNAAEPPQPCAHSRSARRSTRVATLKASRQFSRYQDIENIGRHQMKYGN